MNFREVLEGVDSILIHPFSMAECDEVKTENSKE